MKETAKNSLFVATGGILGALLRDGIGTLLAPEAIAAVLICNVFGCILFSIYADFEKAKHPHFKKLHTVGFCGGLTTFSTFSIQVAMLVRGGEYFGALALFIGTFASCLAAAALSKPLVEHAMRKYLKMRPKSTVEKGVKRV